jgi:hypothetical protein
MCKEMVRDDLKNAQKDKILKDHGFNISISKEN